MVNDHLDSQGIVDVYKEGVDSIMALGLNGRGVHSGNGSQKCSVVGILATWITIYYY